MDVEFLHIPLLVALKILINAPLFPIVRARMIKEEKTRLRNESK
jgi:hypothetical protein